MKSSIDILRHIFAIAVIAQHMTSASRYSVETNLELARIINWIDGAVIGFFLISGYLFKAQNNIFAYCRKQTIRLIIPFFLFSLIYSVLLAILGKESLVDGLEKTVRLQGAGMQLYYLPYLLFVTIVFSIVERRFRQYGVGFVGALAIFAGGAAFIFPVAVSTEHF